MTLKWGVLFQASCRNPRNGTLKAIDKVTLLIDLDKGDIPEASIPEVDILAIHNGVGTVVEPLVVNARQEDVALTEHTPAE